MWYKFDKNTLTYKKVTGRLLLSLISITIVLCTMSSIIIIYQSRNVYYVSDETRAIVLTEENEFTAQKFKDYLIQLNIKYPDIVFAQSQLETNNFTSNIFKENHNLFGMRASNGRPTTSDGINNTYCVYHCWKESVLDYAFYASAYLNNIQTKEQYLQYLGQSYAEDTAYVVKILSQMQRNK